ncbi:MAG: sigma 54-interacting transcriptional regulator [Myxococcales bacterium]|nr:sigma 54-interacting transcriptional regulator [Myxococcales bacterium]
MAGETVAVHELPATGSVELGRAVDAPIRIDHPSISRRHLRLWLASGLEAEDLGGTNGTSLRGVRLPAHRRVPLGCDEVLIVGEVAVVIQDRARLTSATAAPRPPKPSGPVAPIAGDVVLRDPAMVRLHELATRVARGRIPVLITGETGTGKEVLAELLHRASPRAAGPLIRINCAALPEALVESEIFGHEKGAFTGADRSRVGLLEAGHGGTVLLDEVGELPLLVQAKLLRVLEHGAVTPVGATAPRTVDVRVVAATNRDLEAEIAAGRFRSDLYFRIAGVVLVVPPLRARPAEIEPLASAWLARAAAALDRPTLRLSAAALDQLRRHPWPGNVRELRSAMERAALMAPDDTVEPAHLELRGGPALAAAAPPVSPPTTDERERIVDALAACAGNQSRAAAMLGMPRRTLVKRLAELAIPRPRRG